MLFSTVVIFTLVFFMQNCAQQSSTSTLVTETAIPLVIVSSTTAGINLTESATTSFAISLNSAPNSDVTMTATSNNTNIATVLPTSLNFTPSNWNSAQNITLTAVEDDNIENEDTTITVVSPGLPTLTLTVHITDNDSLALHTNVNAVTLNENANNTFTISLSAQPSASVVVNINSSNTNAAIVTPSSLIFTSANWNTPQSVTISGVDDVNVTDDDVSVAVQSSGLTSLNVNTHVIDDDILSIVSDLTTINVNEGATSSLGIKLNAQPPANTTVALMTNDNTAATVTPASLVFTPTNWSTYQYAVISGVPDFDTSNESASLILTNSAMPNKTITIAVTDTTPIPIALGNPCTADNTCASGFCTDGVCCEARCGGTCEKCNLTARLGHCDAIPAGIDLDAECTNMLASTCQRTGQCTGARSCALYAAGTICTAAFCSGDTAVNADTCDGSGTCVDNGSVSCGAGNCHVANGQCR